MELEYIHKKEITEHDNGHIHEIVRNQYRGQQSFSSEGCFPSSIEFKSDGESEKNAISEAEAKPEASKSTPANTIAIIAETEGVCTVILLKISANWHK